MASRGRQSVTAARFIGQFAVQQGRTEVDKALDRIQDQAATLIDQLGQLSRVQPEETSVPVDLPAAAEVEPDVAELVTVPDEPSAPEVPVAEVNGSIPDYDSLAASQVVPRLGGLTDSELETIRQYESAHRGRTTILTRIAQLQRP
jgi:hypothetical protein